MVKLGIIGGGQLGLMLCESALQIYFITHIYIFSDKKDDISCNISVALCIYMHMVYLYIPI